MTATTFSGADEPVGSVAIRDPSDTSSRRWRSVWRIHFYSGMFAIPFIFLMALTGLVILYTQPLQDALQGNLRTVSVGSETLPLAEQEQAVEAAFPDASVVSMTMPVDDHHSTIFGLDDGTESGAEVFVDPYTGEVLGDTGAGGGMVGLANRLHGFLNNDSVTVDLPTVSALWDGEAVMRPYVVGDFVLELLGVWTLVLILSGVFLWWPRRSRSGGVERNGRRPFAVRLGKRGRARWRDLHALSGIVMFSLLALTIVSGLAWSTYWGANFTALANEISPNTWTDAPASAVGQRGDLDRLGNRIHWNTGDIPIPASYASESDGSAPVPISLDDVAAIADDEGMQPGYTVAFPVNDTEGDEPVFGSFTLSNSWPRKTGEAKDVFLDQFTGQKLAQQDVYGYGSVSQGMDTLVSVHMGTQLGVFTRIVMTAMALLAMWSAVSALVMFWKRRQSGSFGLPRRPVDVRLAKGLAVVAVVLGIAFPAWGVCALAVLAFDRFVIRKVPPLRRAFGQA